MTVTCTQLDVSLIRTDGGTQPRAELDQARVEYLANLLREDITFRDPLVVFYDGTDYWLADGFHRLAAIMLVALAIAGVDLVQGTQRDAILYSIEANTRHGMPLALFDRKRGATKLLTDPEWAGWSDREIGRRCGLNHETVGKLRQELSGGNRQMTRTVERNGSEYTMTLPTTNRYEPQPEIPLQPFQELARQEWVQEKDEETEQEHTFPSLPQWQEDNEALGLDIWADPLPAQEEPKRIGVPAALLTSETSEWYTPPEYVAMARKLMDGIDLDPASNAYANELVVHAATYYDIEANGLNKDWPGRVWINPPYGRDGGDSNQEIWSRRLIEQYEAGITKEAVLLVNANTEAKWFQPLYNYIICFTNHRIRFYNTEGTPNQPTQGNAFIYFGHQKERFTELFSAFGVVIRRIDNGS